MEYMHLAGADDVKQAGHTMTRAATEMQQAAANMAHAFEMHQRFLDDWLSRYQAVVEIAASAEHAR